MAWLARLFQSVVSNDESYPLCAAIDQIGLTQTTSGGVVLIRWEDVGSVSAYKKDCWMMDQIRVVVRGKDGSCIVCTEDDQPFDALEASIRRFLPDSRPGWYQSLVCSPPFQTEITHIYPFSVQSYRELQA
jgi:hypothetical protein